MKIALISEKYPPDVGGLAVSVERLGRSLHLAGHAVQVFSLTSALPPGESSTADQDGIPVRRVGVHKRTDDTLAAWADTIIHENAHLAKGQPGFDLLHGYFLTQAGFVAAYTARLLALPSVVSARGNDLDRAVFDPGKAVHVLYALQHASAVTANSQELCRKAQALGGRPALYVPNGVDASLFCPQPPDEALRAELGLQAEPELRRQVVGFSGEMRAKKGLGTLLLAVKEVARKRQITLLLAGGVRSGEDRDLIKVFHKQNKDLPLVLLEYKPLERMPALYNLMDVVALPSRHDGLPNALLEAMACARPVIGGRAGGLPDALQDGQNGVLVEPEDVPGLAEAVEGLLADPLKASSLGAAARHTVLANFTPQQELDKTLAVYRDVM